MLAYDEKGLTNLLVRNQAEEAEARSLITTEEKNRILTAYPDNYYSPNIFMRIGLSLVILTATWAIGALVMLIIKPKSVVPYYLLLLSALIFILLELFIRKYHHYRSGIDDLLLYSALVFIYIALAASSLTDIKNFHLILSFSMTISGILAVLRYADRLASLLAFLSGLFLLGAVWYKAGTIAMYTMPLLEILLCLSAYTLARRYRKIPASLYYSGCLRIIEISSLACLYIAGNFYFVDQWWTAQFQSALFSNPWKYSFIAYDILVPAWCLYTGFLNLDKVRIRLAVLMLAASIVTLHYYVSIISNEGAMIIYGMLMIITAYLIIRQLKKGIKGFTNQSQEGNAAWIELEELMLGGSFSTKRKSKENTLSNEIISTEISKLNLS